MLFINRGLGGHFARVLHKLTEVGSNDAWVLIETRGNYAELFKLFKSFSYLELREMGLVLV